jgi:hypothetical protein
MSSLLRWLRPEHSDSIPLELIAPAGELRRFLAGEISAADYDRAIAAGERALSRGYSGRGR